MSLAVLSVGYPLAPVSPDSAGGAEQILAALDRALVEAGHRSIVVAPEGSTVCGALEAIPWRDGTLDDAVRAEAQAARALGFTGKAVLHPSNIATVNTAFAPTEQEVTRAEAIVAAYEASPNGLTVLDGKLVERPVVLAQQRVLRTRDLIKNSNI